MESEKDGVIISYGQTSSGKTYTMIGNLDMRQKNDQQGILPRAIGEVFALIQRRQRLHYTQISVSAIEIYNEQVKDLLNPEHGILKVTVGVNGSNSLPDAVRVPASNEQDCMKLMRLAIGGRAVGKTDMNESSSRSHCIITITLDKYDEDGQSKSNRLIFVDLAGSERQRRSGTEGNALRQGSYINRSLLALGTVMNALNQEKSLQRIPYRDSKLTRLLQDALNGTSLTTILICCSPAASDLSDTLNSLHFGARAKNTKIKMQSRNGKSTAKPGYQILCTCGCSEHNTTYGKSKTGGMPVALRAQDEQTLSLGSLLKAKYRSIERTSILMVLFYIILSLSHTNIGNLCQCME